MLDLYLKKLYQKTMERAYSLAIEEIIRCLTINRGGKILDCGANNGRMFNEIASRTKLEKDMYYGVEWNYDCLIQAQNKGLRIVKGDLNKDIPYSSEEFVCVFGLSLLEHLLNPCRYLKESYRVLQKDGTLVILSPNISTYFTALLILMGKMPSSGPHPDSDLLLRREEIYRVGHEILKPDTETDTPMHRHLIVFSYRVLDDFLKMVGFKEVKGFGFGLYPFPNFLQPFLEKIDPYHCHQMVFIARK